MRKITAEKIYQEREAIHHHELGLQMKAWFPLMMVFFCLLGFIWLCNVASIWRERIIYTQSWTADFVILGFEMFLIGIIWISAHRFVHNFKELIVYDLRKGI
jgi:hypothetical protein